MTFHPYYLLFIFLLGLAFVDNNLIHWAVLQFKRLDLAIERFFFMIKLRFDMWTIRRGFQNGRFDRMAKDLIAELKANEANRP